jgi:hypothetical protein
MFLQDNVSAATLCATIGAMKVRLFEDSVRVRLNQREVLDLGAGRALHSVTRFGVGQLEVEIRPDSDGGIQASLENSRITIEVNATGVREWSVNDVEGLYAMSGPCKVALEKDYACLHKTGEANVGTFPNPVSLSK